MVIDKRLLDLIPVRGVRAVHRDRPHAERLSHTHLVSHEREKRADEDRRPTALVAQYPRRDEVDHALAPAGALHDQHTCAVLNKGNDRLQLTVAELLIVAEGLLKEPLG